MKPTKSSELKNCKSLSQIQFFEQTFRSVKPPHLADSASLVFVSKVEQVNLAKTKNALGLIILEKLFSEISAQQPDLLPKNISIWTTPNIQWAMSDVLQFFNHLKKMATIHPKASISSTAIIGKNVIIDACAVIDDFAVIGDNTHIGANVFIGAYCEIGKNCLIGPNTVIGSEGFGFFTDKNFNHHKIPQIGKVIIEDYIEFGAHCAVDRATLTETRIKSGCKFDNFCHVAHNTEIGQNGLFAAGFISAGSTKFGNNIIAAGGVHVNGHISIADNVILSGRAGVTSSINEPGTFGGFPAIPHKQNIKVMMTMTHLPKIRKQVLMILKHLGLDNKGD